VIEEKKKQAMPVTKSWQPGCQSDRTETASTMRLMRAKSDTMVIDAAICLEIRIGNRACAITFVSQCASELVLIFDVAELASFTLKRCTALSKTNGHKTMRFM
jgi:hypothetical protein